MIRSRTAATAALVMLALAPIASAVGDLGFEDLTDGNSWSGGQSFVTDGVTIDVIDDGAFSGGSVQVENPNNAGSGNGLFVEEVILLLSFDFPFTDAWFDYAVFGGDLAVVVNGTIYAGADPIDLAGVYPGGVFIDVVEDIQGFTGSVHVHANITQFGIGVEDGDIDNVGCIPTPSASSALVLGVLAASRRRRR